MNEVLTVILGGGRGTRLYPLTKYRAKPAVPIGGKYRLIDIPLSNCVHYDFNRIFVLTQFMSESLTRHVIRAFTFDRLRRGFVDVVTASQSRQTGDDWFQGTADAVRKSMLYFREHPFRDYLILSGDHLYRMDYGKMLREHKNNHADLTVATLPVSEDKISNFGIMKVDHGDRIVDFTEKPQEVGQVKDYQTVWTDNKNSSDCYLASMGIYIFRREVLERLLKEIPEEDFGYHIVPMAIKSKRTFAYRFNGYWEDIGKIEDFFRANIQLTCPNPVFTFYDPKRPIFTRPRILPGSMFEKTDIDQAIIAEGCNINRARINKSVIGIRSIIGAGSELSETLMMGADYYEGEGYYPDLKGRHLPNIGIGPNCRIHRAIIDKNVRIGARVTIGPKQTNQNYDGEGYVVRSGITVVEKNAVIPSGTDI